MAPSSRYKHPTVALLESNSVGLELATDWCGRRGAYHYAISPTRRPEILVVFESINNSDNACLSSPNQIVCVYCVAAINFLQIIPLHFDLIPDSANVKIFSRVILTNDVRAVF